LQARLSAQGFSVQVAGDGPSGLAAAAKDHPDVILLDLRMPDMDGFEVLRRLRATPEIACIPVIFLTANIQDTVRQQALSAGAVGFLTKPYEAGAVVDAILAATLTATMGKAA
jgi:CheY-like chemotaxis protein